MFPTMAGFILRFIAASTLESGLGGVALGSLVAEVLDRSQGSGLTAPSHTITPTHLHP